jgi:hypothetical protein
MYTVAAPPAPKGRVLGTPGLLPIAAGAQIIASDGFSGGRLTGSSFQTRLSFCGNDFVLG